jgi:carboxymethylenebutenolidase
MARANTEQFSQEVLDLFDRYVHGLVDRRGFLDQAAALSAGTSPEALLEALSPRFAEARQIAPDDAPR